MPPILTLCLEVGLICGITVWQWRKLQGAAVKKVEGSVFTHKRRSRSRQQFSPKLSFMLYWLQCLGLSVALWLFNVVISWSQLGSLDAAWSGLGVMFTLAFLAGLVLSGWLFAGWWQPSIQHSFDILGGPRPQPRRRRRITTPKEPLENKGAAESSFLDLAPYPELKPPTSNSQVKWCDECGRWTGNYHRHGAVAV